MSETEGERERLHPSSKYALLLPSTQKITEQTNSRNQIIKFGLSLLFFYLWEDTKVVEVTPDNPKWYTIFHELIILDYKAVAWEGNGLQIGILTRKVKKKGQVI